MAKDIAVVTVVRPSASEIRSRLRYGWLTFDVPLTNNPKKDKPSGTQSVNYLPFVNVWLPKALIRVVGQGACAGLFMEGRKRESCSYTK